MQEMRRGYNEQGEEVRRIQMDKFHVLCYSKDQDNLIMTGTVKEEGIANQVKAFKRMFGAKNVEFVIGSDQEFQEWKS